MRIRGGLTFEGMRSGGVLMSDGYEPCLSERSEAWQNHRHLQSTGMSLPIGSSSASNFPLDARDHSRTKSDDRQRLRVPRVWEVGPGLFFRFPFDVT